MLIGLRAHLTATTVIFILCNGSRRVGTPAVRKTLTVVKAATASLQYSFTTAGHIHYQTLRVYIRRIAEIDRLVLPILLAAPPPYSTYPHGGSLPPRHLVFHFPTRPVFLRQFHLRSSHTSTATISLAAYGGLQVPRLHLSFFSHYHFWNFNNAPHIHTILISYPTLIRPNSFRHSLHLTLFNSGTLIIGSSRKSSAPHIHNHTISIRYLALLRPNFFLRHSHHHVLPYKGPNSFQSFPSGVKPAAAKTYTSSLTHCHSTSG